jgi:hypothetical protein
MVLHRSPSSTPKATHVHNVLLSLVRSLIRFDYMMQKCFSERSQCLPQGVADCHKTSFKHQCHLMRAPISMPWPKICRSDCGQAALADPTFNLLHATIQYNYTNHRTPPLRQLEQIRAPMHRNLRAPRNLYLQSEAGIYKLRHAIDVHVICRPASKYLAPLHMYNHFSSQHQLIYTDISHLVHRVYHNEHAVMESTDLLEYVSRVMPLMFTSSAGRLPSIWHHCTCTTTSVHNIH